MKFSERWLREWFDPAVDTAGLAKQLTMAGLEVDGVEAVAEAFEGVVVAKVVSAEPHPDADRLRVCEVDAGDGEILPIVCGAPNARAGLMAPLAVVGAVLPGDFKIKRAKLRGQESRGMLCSPKELGLAEDADGLLELPEDAPVGASLRDYLQLDDSAIDVDLTPNRADCLSIRGIARDLAALNGAQLEAPPVPVVFAGHNESLEINLEAPADCPRYVGRLIRGINPDATTPLWLQEKLRRSGLRPISPVVDVTNLVMLEQGQPMHAFDAATLSGPVGVRRGRDGEELTLLDGKSVSLDDSLLVITDDDKPVALAGIMGGASTAVTDSTTDIFFESAYFSPAAIMGRARRLGLHTDASHRFERGVDPEGQSRAIDRASALLVEIAGGDAGPVKEACVPDALPVAPTVPLRLDRVTRVLGTDIPATSVVSMLERLGMSVEGNADGWQVVPPSWRFDIAIEEDLIEEVGRLYGYDTISPRPLEGTVSVAQDSEHQVHLSELRRALTNRGYQEAINFSFVGRSDEAEFGLSHEVWPLANPLSEDLAVLRGSLFPSLLRNLAFNVRRQQRRARLFETGVVFRQNDGAVEEFSHLALVAYGARYPEQWSGDDRATDFYDLKGDLEALFDRTGDAGEFEFLPGSHSWLHPVQAADIRRGDHDIGWAGVLHPSLAQRLDIAGVVCVAEIDLAVAQSARLPEAGMISRYPEVRRDIALIVRDNVEWWAVTGAISEAQPEHLQRARLFDVYRGDGIEKGYKSLAIGLFFQHNERTLTDAEVDDVVASIVQRLEDDLDAKLRG